jgi:hypothetical protein
MSRSLGIVCAGALVLATAGCTLDSLFLSFTGSNRKEQEVTVSVDQVSASLHATLASRFPGLKIEDSRQGEELHLKGMTNTGKKFEFIVLRRRSQFGDRTVVAFEGDKEAEALLWFVAINGVVNPAPPGQQPGVQPAAGSLPDATPGAMPFDRVRGGIQ